MGLQVTRFAAPMAYNYLHVIRMNEYLGEDRVLPGLQNPTQTLKP